MFSFQIWNKALHKNNNLTKTSFRCILNNNFRCIQNNKKCFYTRIHKFWFFFFFWGYLSNDRFPLEFCFHQLFDCKRPTLGHWRRGSLTHPTFISALCVSEIRSENLLIQGWRAISMCVWVLISALASALFPIWVYQSIFLNEFMLTATFVVFLFLSMFFSFKTYFWLFLQSGSFLKNLHCLC